MSESKCNFTVAYSHGTSPTHLVLVRFTVYSYDTVMCHMSQCYIVEYALRWVHSVYEQGPNTPKNDLGTAVSQPKSVKQHLKLIFPVERLDSVLLATVTIMHVRHHLTLQHTFLGFYSIVRAPNSARIASTRAERCLCCLCSELEQVHQRVGV